MTPLAQTRSLDVGRDEDRAELLLRAAAAKLETVNSYACTVLCQDRIGGTLRRQERIQSLFRAPQSVYLRWLPGGPFEGLQASYVPERDGRDKFMAREQGLTIVLAWLTRCTPTTSGPTRRAPTSW